MLAKKIGIDLGTSTLRAYVRGAGIVADEPSLLAVDRRRGRVVAVGARALDALGRRPDALRAERPVQGGQIVDLVGAGAMLDHLIGRAQGGLHLGRPEVMICVPYGVSGTGRRALTEAAIRAGSRQAWLLDAPLAAAIGADMPVGDRRGQAICDIGGGTAEIAVISLSGLVTSSAVPVGGNRLDQAVVALLERRHGLLIDEHAAEDARTRAGAVAPTSGPLRIDVSGKDVASGASRTLSLEPAEVVEALQEPLSAIATEIREVLTQTPPELVRDIERGGITLTGGGALLRGLDRYLADRVGLPTRVAAGAPACAARGAGLALDRFEVLRGGNLSLR